MARTIMQGAALVSILAVRGLTVWFPSDASETEAPEPVRSVAASKPATSDSLLNVTQRLNEDEHRLASDPWWRLLFFADVATFFRDSARAEALRKLDSRSETVRYISASQAAPNAGKN